MRTRDKIRLSNAFKRGMSFIEIFARYKCAKNGCDVEEAVRWTLNRRKGDRG